MTSSSRVDLTVVIPTYNERDRLAELVQRLFAGANTFGIDLEVVIVDDNSPDGTGQIADQLAQAYRVQVIHRTGKLGLGTAVVAGFAQANGETVGVMDADFSHPPALMPKMFAAFKRTKADVLVASRYVPGGSTPNWPFSRRLMSRSACLLARGLSPIRDAASGYFLIRRDIARRVTIKAGGFKICLELIVRAWPTTLVELPYQFDDREQGESKMNKREAAGYLWQLKDLYLLRWSQFNRPARTYKCLSVAEVERLEVRGDRSEFR